MERWHVHGGKIQVCVCVCVSSSFNAKGRAYTFVVFWQEMYVRIKGNTC